MLQAYCKSYSPYSNQASISTIAFNIWIIELEYLGQTACHVAWQRFWHIWGNICNILIIFSKAGLFPFFEIDIFSQTKQLSLWVGFFFPEFVFCHPSTLTFFLPPCLEGQLFLICQNIIFTLLQKLHMHNLICLVLLIC